MIKSTAALRCLKIERRSPIAAGNPPEPHWLGAQDQPSPHNVQGGSRVVNKQEVQMERQKCRENLAGNGTAGHATFGNGSDVGGRGWIESSGA